jgi:hypothetical protein
MKGIVRSPILVLLLSIITCGIYFFYWLYATANELRLYLNDESINPGIDLLISIICAPYIIYWMYKYSKLAAEAQNRAGIYPVEDNSIICLILPIFGFAIISALIIQSSLNRVWQS